MRLQRGAAILTALLLMALVATLSTAALWQQARALDLEASERARVQAQWILQGATDWARLILREDARTATIDHLGEPWAITLQEAKLSSFLANGTAIDDTLPADVLQSAYLSGGISDLQARLNTTNLVLDADIHPPALQAFARLFDLLQLPPAELQLLVSNLRAGLQAPSTKPAAQQTATGTPLLPRNREQLLWLGLSERTLAQLSPYIVVLPDRSTVNVNTASALVLQASIPGMDSTTAQRLVERRAQSPLRSMAEVQAATGLPETALKDTQLSVNSRFFEVRTRLRLGGFATQERTTLQREGLLVKPLWKEREAPVDAFVQ